MRLRDRRQGQRRLPENFPVRKSRRPARAESLHPESAIDQDVSGRNDFDRRHRCVAQPSDRFAAVVFLNLLDGKVEILCANRGSLIIDNRGGIFSLRHTLED